MSNQENSKMLGESSPEIDLETHSYFNSEILENRYEGAIIGGSIGFNVGWIIGLFGWLVIQIVVVLIISIIICTLVGVMLGRNSNLRFPAIPVGIIKYLLLALSFTNVLIGLIFGFVYLRKPRSGSHQFAKQIFIVTGIGFAIFVFTLI